MTITGGVAMRASSSGTIGRLLLGLLIALHLMVVTTEASAQRRGGGGGGRGGGGGAARAGGGGAARAGGGAQARTSVNRSFNSGGGDRSFSGANVDRGQINTANVNRANINTANVNRANVNRANVNANVDRNINVNNDWDWDVDDHWHPVATAAAVTAGAAITAAAVGSVVNTLPPACAATVVNGVTYQQCGSTWYEPRFYGSSVEYVVVNAP